LDNTEPVIEDIDYDEENNKVTVTASDNYGLYYVEAVDASDNITREEFTDMDGVYTATLDVSELDEDYDLYVYDYVYNYATTKEKTEISEGTGITVTETDAYYDGNIFYKTISIENTSDKPVKVTPIMAVYSKDGELLKAVKGATINDFIGSKECTLKMKLTGSNFPDLQIPDGAELKLYLWDSLEDMNPVDYTFIAADNENTDDVG
jgi:hypothetical protein